MKALKFALGIFLFVSATTVLQAQTVTVFNYTCSAVEFNAELGDPASCKQNGWASGIVFPNLPQTINMVVYPGPPASLEIDWCVAQSTSTSCTPVPALYNACTAVMKSGDVCCGGPTFLDVRLHVFGFNNHLVEVHQ